MRFNASSILSKVNTAVKTAEKVMDKLNSSSTDLVTKWFTAGAFAKAAREATMWALMAEIEKVMDLGAVESPTFSAVVKPYFTEFDSAESKAFAKLDSSQQRTFAKGWSEVVCVSVTTGKKASNRRKDRKTVDVPSYKSVLHSAKALTTEEQNSLLIALAKNLGISTKSLRVA